MTLHTYSDLNALQLDVLKELGNIGAGNAATALSAMLDHAIGLNVPDIRLLSYQEVTEALGGPENMIVGIMLSLEGDLSGMMMFLLPRSFAHMTLNTLLGVSFRDFSSIDDMGYSAMKEVANIMASSYVNAIAQLTGMRIQITVPDLCMDMAGAILSVPAIQFANVSDKIIFIADEFLCGEERAESHILMIPDMASLEKLMAKLGVDR